LASSMKILMAGYEQQMNELQGAGGRSETAIPTVGLTQEHDNAEVDSTAYPSVEGVGNGGDSGMFDVGFDWDSSANMIWDNMLENFTMIPFS
jgi:hypothetical protein